MRAFFQISAKRTCCGSAPETISWIDVRERRRKYIGAYCHLRETMRTLKRCGIKSIESV
ncbi:MAG: hypothetical protein AAE987_03090 [Thermoplasmataceae archaeon]